MSGDDRESYMPRRPIKWFAYWSALTFATVFMGIVGGWLALELIRWWLGY